MLEGTAIDLNAQTATLAARQLAQVLAVSPTLLASTGGDQGLLFTDITNPSAPRDVVDLKLETTANQLLLDGTKLYVLGDGYMTVVETSGKAPAELKQATSHRYTRTWSDTVVVPINESGGRGKGGADDQFMATVAEPIQSVEIDLDITHAQPQQLTMALSVTRDGQVTNFPLRDQVAGPGGDKVYKFTNTNTKALQALVGTLTTGYWDVTVTDNVADGVTGTLNSAKIILKTATRAFALPAGDTQLVGLLPNHALAIAGLGLQVVDASKPTALKQLSSLTGTGVYASGLSGTTALVLSPQAVSSGGSAGGKGSAGGGGGLDFDDVEAKGATQTHALYAVDLSKPSKPVVLRQDESFGDDGGGALSLVGTRAYLYTADAAQTSILDVKAFAANSASYVLGTLPGQVGSVIGSDTQVFGVGLGIVEGFDMSKPATPLQNYAWATIPVKTLLPVKGRRRRWSTATYSRWWAR